MKKELLLLLFVTILSFNCYSQITFEKGYYINNAGQKTDCLIKNNDWKNNPINFEYKDLTTEEPKTLNIESVQEFGLYNISKYIRKKVKLDISSRILNDMSFDKNPVFIEKPLFLKVLIQGKANLFLYQEGNMIRYFYSTENVDINQLIYKIYKISETQTAKNNGFKQQLWSDLQCSSIKINSIEKLEYRKNSLVKFFSLYNKCTNSGFINYDGKQERDFFNLTIRPRLNSSSLSIANPTYNSRNIDFGKKSGFGLGIEAEFILPFNKNKWAILIEPTFQNYANKNTREVSNVSGGKLISEVKYNSIEIPISLRHYFFLNDNSKIFINTSYIFDSSSKSYINFKRADNSEIDSLVISSHSNLAFGIGYKLQDKYSLEVRFQTGREVLAQYASWSSSYKTVSIILGYSIF